MGLSEWLRLDTSLEDVETIVAGVCGNLADGRGIFLCVWGCVYVLWSFRHSWLGLRLSFCLLCFPFTRTARMPLWCCLLCARQDRKGWIVDPVLPKSASCENGPCRGCSATVSQMLDGSHVTKCWLPWCPWREHKQICFYFRKTNKNCHLWLDCWAHIRPTICEHFVGILNDAIRAVFLHFLCSFFELTSRILDLLHPSPSSHSECRMHFSRFIVRG